MAETLGGEAAMPWHFPELQLDQFSLIKQENCEPDFSLESLLCDEPFLPPPEPIYSNTAPVEDIAFSSLDPASFLIPSSHDTQQPSLVKTEPVSDNESSQQDSAASTVPAHNEMFVLDSTTTKDEYKPFSLLADSENAVSKTKESMTFDSSKPTQVVFVSSPGGTSMQEMTVATEVLQNAIHLHEATKALNNHNVMNSQDLKVEDNNNNDKEVITQEANGFATASQNISTTSCQPQVSSVQDIFTSDSISHRAMTLKQEPPGENGPVNVLTLNSDEMQQAGLMPESLLSSGIQSEYPLVHVKQEPTNCDVAPSDNANTYVIQNSLISAPSTLSTYQPHAQIISSSTQPNGAIRQLLSNRAPSLQSSNQAKRKNHASSTTSKPVKLAKVGKSEPPTQSWKPLILNAQQVNGSVSQGSTVVNVQSGVPATSNGKQPVIILPKGLKSCKIVKVIGNVGQYGSKLKPMGNNYKPRPIILQSGKANQPLAITVPLPASQGENTKTTYSTTKPIRPSTTSDILCDNYPNSVFSKSGVEKVIKTEKSCMLNGNNEKKHTRKPRITIPSRKYPVFSNISHLKQELPKGQNSEKRKLCQQFMNRFTCKGCSKIFALNRILIRRGNTVIQGRPQVCIKCYDQVKARRKEKEEAGEEYVDIMDDMEDWEEEDEITYGSEMELDFDDASIGSNLAL